MTRKEKNEIKKWADNLSDEQLEQAYYDSLFGCLGSQCDDMYELGYDISDIIERQKYEKFLGQKVDCLEYLCNERGIELFKEQKNEINKK